MDPEAVTRAGAPRPAGFPRSHRVVHRLDFQRIYRTGSRARGDQLTVVCAPNGLDHPRLGLSVGRKVWRSAVRRNRVRRIFREAFRLSQHDLPPGFDLILIPAAARLDPELEATRTELVQLAAKAVRRYRERHPE